MTLLFHFTESTFYLLSVAISRTLIILLMSFTAIYSYLTSTSLSSSKPFTPKAEAFNISSFGLSVPIIFLTMGFHLLIPDVYQALKNKKKNAGRLVVFSFSIAFFLIVVLSLSLAFGCEEVKQLATLNWNGFSLGNEFDERPFWTVLAEFFISIYPCIDVTSIFSMTAVNVADNILALQFHGLDDFVVEPDKVFNMRSCILIVSFWLSGYFYDLGIVFALAGSINLVFLFLFVIMFGIASLVIVPQKMHFDNFLARRKVLIGFLMASALFLVAMWGSFISYLIGNQ
jgi:amino acid permease